MRAMVLEAVKSPLKLREIPKPRPGKGQLLIHILACGVCRTDLHIFDGELPPPHLPLILGHQIVGIIEEIGSEVTRFSHGQLVGIPWLGHTCGHCSFCLSGKENLCDTPLFTGYHLNGGFAEYCTAYADFALPLPESTDPLHVAPILCGGLIGYRALRMAGDAKTIGFYGFGSSAHMLIQAARYQGRQVYVFTRPGDRKGQEFATYLGAHWAGCSDEMPPVHLDAAIIFAPVGSLVPTALKAVGKAGVVICAGIHMSDIPSFPYDDLWNEKILRSVANLTREDGHEFLELALKIGIQTHAVPYSLENANQALNDLRHGAFKGTAVIV